jgi:hypothetical protein
MASICQETLVYVSVWLTQTIRAEPWMCDSLIFILSIMPSRDADTDFLFRHHEEKASLQ